MSEEVASRVQCSKASCYMQQINRLRTYTYKDYTFS